MARLSPFNACLLFCALRICSVNGVDLDKHLQQLKENYEILAAILNLLENLERKVDEHETLLAALKNEHETLLAALKNEHKTKSFQKIVPSNSVIERQSSRKKTIFKTCQDIRAAHPTQISGMNWIDPDGHGVGDDPIYVYCNMTSGSTSILHDSESQVTVTHCTGPGCSSRLINYSATIKQISALAELSSECHQPIRYDCTNAPFEINGISYSWWNDKHGNPQYFWSGSRTSLHTCHCGIEHNCFQAFTECNCNSNLPIPLADYGIISDKEILPITRLNFGRTLQTSSSGKFTLGRFVCSGQINRMPSSCEDLLHIGHKLNGLHLITRVGTVETVYCDFSKSPKDPGFEKSLGFGYDTRSTPTYFYVQKNTTFSTTNVPITFEIGKVNVGKAMDLKTGIFTSPRTGKCFFSFTGLARFPASSAYKLRLGVGLYLNGYLHGRGWVANTGNNHWGQFTLQSTLDLNSGDRVWLQITDVSDGVYLYDNGNHYTHFTGWHLEEEMSNSL